MRRITTAAASGRCSCPLFNGSESRIAAGSIGHDKRQVTLGELREREMRLAPVVAPLNDLPSPIPDGADMEQDGQPHSQVLAAGDAILSSGHSQRMVAGRTPIWLRFLKLRTETSRKPSAL